MISIYPLDTSSVIQTGDDLAQNIIQSLEEFFPLTNTDVIIFSSLAISIVQGNIVKSKNDHEKSKVIEQESKRILRVRDDIRIIETRHGFICENGGVVAISEAELLLLPLDPDKAAHSLRQALLNKTGFDIPVVISASFYRPFRKGKVSVAIGLSGLKSDDAYCDELASASSLASVDSPCYAFLIRGIGEKHLGNGRAKDLITPSQEELFS